MIKHSFIALREYEVTVLTGEYFEIFEEEKNWFRGRNFHNKTKFGIFPKSCCTFVKTDDISFNSFMGVQDDLLIQEALLTLKYALNQYKKMTTKGKLNIFDNISDMVNILKRMEDPNNHFLNEFAHHSLGIKVKNMREHLGFPTALRNSMYSFVTVSNWGLPNFLSQNMPVPPDSTQGNKRVILHVHVEIQNFTQTRFFRFGLYENSSNPWVSEPFYTLLTPMQSSIDFAFDQIDAEILKKPIYLVIYYDTLKSSGNQINDTRICQGCAVSKLSFCKELFETTLTERVNSYAITNDSSQLFHVSLINELNANNQTPDKLSFVVANTVFNAEYSLVEMMKRKTSQLYHVYPYRLPAQISYKSQRSTLALNINKIENDSARSAMKYIVRLFDNKKKEFVQGFSDSNHIDLEPKYTADAFVSLTMKAKKDTYIDESVIVDLFPLSECVDDLYFFIEIQKSGMLSNDVKPHGYSFIKIISNNGCLQPTNSTVNVFPLSYKGEEPDPKKLKIETKEKAIGKVHYSTIPASVLIAPVEAVHVLINNTKFDQNVVRKALNDVKNVPLTSWFSFVRILFLGLAEIIERAGQLRNPALEALFALVHNALNSKSEHNYSKTLDQFITNELNRDAANAKNLKHIYEPILTELIRLISLEYQENDFHPENFVVLPFFVKLSSASFQLDEEGKKEQFRESMGFIFQRLNAIMQMEETDDNRSWLAKAKIATMSCISEIINNLVPSYSPAEAAESFVMFMKASEVEGESILSQDRRLDALIKITEMPILNQPEAQQIINNYFKETITKLKEEVKHERKIVELIARIFFNERTTFILEFSDIFLEIATRKLTPNEYMQLLCSIIYQFPREFPIDVGFMILQNAVIEPPFKLFMYVLFLSENFERISKILKDKSVDIQRKINIFQSCFLASCYAATPYGIPLDTAMHRYIYSIDNYFKILADLYKELPIEDQLNTELFVDILHSYSYYESADIRDMFFCIVNADYELNGNTSKVLEAVFLALKKLSNIQNFIKTESLFTSDNKNFEMFCKATKENVKVFYVIAKYKMISENEIKIVESSEVIISNAKQYGIHDIAREMLSNIYNLHTKLNNKLEATFALYSILEFLPINNTSRISIRGEAQRSGRSVAKEIYERVINSLIENHQENLAIGIIKEMRKKIITPFKNFDILPNNYKLEAQCYRAVTANATFNSKYFRVRFLGKPKESIEELGQTYIYRKDSNVNISDFFQYIQKCYKGASVKSEKPPATIPDDGLLHIYIDSVKPTVVDKEADILFDSNENKTQYISQFEDNTFPTVFLSDTVKSTVPGDKTPFSREFIHIGKPLPSYTSRRLATKIIMQKSTVIEHACFLATTEKMKLMKEEFEMRSKDLSSKAKFILTLNRSLIEMNDRILRDTMLDKIEASYFVSHAEDQRALRAFIKTCVEFRDLFHEQMKMMEEFIATNGKGLDSVLDSAKETLQKFTAVVNKAEEGIQGM